MLNQIDLTLTGVVGLLTFILTLLVKIIGVPDQIKQNYLNKSTKGLSVKLFILSFASYLAWTIHGVLKKDMVIILGQFPGVLMTGIILHQIFIYRNNK